MGAPECAERPFEGRVEPARRRSRSDPRLEVRGRRASRGGGEDTEHDERGVRHRVLDDVHRARREPERRPGPSSSSAVEMEAATASQHPDDLVVEVVVQDSGHVTDEERARVDPLSGPKRSWNDRLPVAVLASASASRTSSSRSPIGAWRSSPSPATAQTTARPSSCAELSTTSRGRARAAVPTVRSCVSPIRTVPPALEGEEQCVALRALDARARRTEAAYGERRGDDSMCGTR